MPLCTDAEKLIRANLESWKRGKRPPLVVIGSLTKKQVDDINAERATRNMQPIAAEIVFIGRHVYQSRCEQDGYTIEDVIEQMTCALHEESVFMPLARMTTITRTTTRKDRLGNEVTDTATFECSQRHPRPELFSVCPKGDSIRPAQMVCKNK
jgi:hypothetical protein